MGTACNVLIACEEDEFEVIFRKIKQEILRIEDILSIYNPESEFSLINKHAVKNDFPVSDECYEIINKCLKFNKLTLGNFDITAGSRKKITQDRLSVHPDNKTIRIVDEQTQIDSGGFGKGYALDKVEEILISFQLKSALINFGNSSILAFGGNPAGNKWSIGIVNPSNSNENLYIYEGKDLHISSSGNAEKGKHIYNKNTEELVENNMLTTCNTDSCFLSEAVSTALFAASETESVQIVQNTKARAARCFPDKKTIKEYKYSLKDEAN